MSSNSRILYFLLGLFCGGAGRFLSLFLFVFQVNMYGSVAAFAFLKSKKSLRKILFRLCGADEYVEKLLRDAKRLEKQRMQALTRSVGDILNDSMAKNRAQQQKQLLLLKAVALSVLNMDPDPSSRNFTFWQRRTKTIQSDIDALRERMKTSPEKTRNDTPKSKARNGVTFTTPTTRTK